MANDEDTLAAPQPGPEQEDETRTVSVVWRIARDVDDAIELRARQEGIAHGELITYCFVRLSQLEEAMTAGNETRAMEIVREIGQWASQEGTGAIARWVQHHLASEARARQIHPPTPEMWRRLDEPPTDA